MISSEALSSTTTSLLPLNDEVSCEGEENFRRFAHPISCSMYFECHDERAFLVSCPLGRYFDEIQEICLDFSQVDCNARTRRPTTTTSTTIFPPILDPQCEDVEDGRNVSNPFSW